MSGGWSGGVFSLSVDMSANEAAGIPIVSSAFSNQSDEIKDGINACLTKDGTNYPSADLPMATKKHTNVGAAVGITNYLRTHEYITQNPIYMRDQDTGSTVSVSCSATYWPTSAVEGMIARIRIGATKPQASASQVEIVINGITLSAVMPDGTNLVPGALKSDSIHDFIYDGSKFRLMNPAVSIKTYAAVMKCRGVANASVTISAQPTVSILAAVNDDVVHMALKNQAGNIVKLQTSGGTYIVWSAAPSHLCADLTTHVGGLFIDTSVSTSTAEINNPAQLIVGPTYIKIQCFATNKRFGTNPYFKPFSVTYSRRRTV